MMVAVTTTRRQFIGNAGLVAGAGFLAPSVTVATAFSDGSDSPEVSTPTHWQAGLQIYTLGEAPAKDLSGTLGRVAEIGYRSVELPGHYGRSPEQLRYAIETARLVCPGVHVTPTPMGHTWDLQGDMNALADNLHVVGAEYAVVSIALLPDRVLQKIANPPAEGLDVPTLSALFDSLTPDDWKRTADLLNERSEKLVRSDVRLAYHNHAFEFSIVGSQPAGFDILVEKTDPVLVDFELDIGWAVSAGQDLSELFRRLNKRIRLLHLKDVGRTSDYSAEMIPADVGTGIVDWSDVIRMSLEAGVSHSFIEQEPPFVSSRIRAVEVAYEYLTTAYAAEAAQ